MFEINQKVVCIDDKFTQIDHERFDDLPKEGQVYAVRDVVSGLSHDFRETCAIYLKEIISKPNKHGIEPGFEARRFRELDEISTTDARRYSEPKRKSKPAERELVTV